MNYVHVKILSLSLSCCYHEHWADDGRLMRSSASSNLINQLWVTLQDGRHPHFWMTLLQPALASSYYDPDADHKPKFCQNMIKVLLKAQSQFTIKVLSCWFYLTCRFYRPNGKLHREGVLLLKLFFGLVICHMYNM